jgi:branched-chain amino acid transport system permease protein
MVILGGMGSIPGAMLGAIIVTMLDLQILPRIAAVLREAQAAGAPIPRQFDPTQYQRLLFGLLLVLMMIFRQEGLWPDERRREEQHDVVATDEELETDAVNQPAGTDTGR